MFKELSQTKHVTKHPDSPGLGLELTDVEILYNKIKRKMKQTVLDLLTFVPLNQEKNNKSHFLFSLANQQTFNCLT